MLLLLSSLNFAANFYPPKANLNAEQISFNCGIAAGIVISFISDAQSQATYRFGVKYDDDKIYAAGCHDIGKNVVAVTIRRAGGYEHDDGLMIWVNAKARLIKKIRYARGNERVVNIQWILGAPNNQ
jgi:hypothetical protein